MITPDQLITFRNSPRFQKYMVLVGSVTYQSILNGCLNNILNKNYTVNTLRSVADRLTRPNADHT